MADGATAHPTVVGIGASAGGLAALRAFFSLVPGDSGLAYVVVVHLAPEYESHLAELLQPHVEVPIQQVSETVQLEADHAYIIPPNANLEAVDTHLRLSELEARRRMRAPIDHFFRTLSRTHQGHAIGVILTGTGSDGTLGLKEIKEKGGLTVVQDPRDAEYDGMPQSAVATGQVDLILPLTDIPGAIVRYAETKPQVLVPLEDEPVEGDGRQLLRKVFAQIRARTGRDFSHYKRSTVLRRISRRMQLTHVEAPHAYLNLLRDRPEEVLALADDLLITVTNFFRDPEVFEALEAEVIPQLFLGKSPEGEVRVWSIGCATGEEAYTLAILLMEEAARLETPPRIQVFASDLHERSLAKARAGFYPGDIETDVRPERLRRFFVRENGGYRIRSDIRDLVVFAPHNLLGDPPFNRLDLIACRNLLIYLQREIQSDVFNLLHYALNPQGFLLLGSAERADANDLFLSEDKKHGIYRKRDVPVHEPRLPVFPGTLDRFPHGERPAEGREELITRGRLHQRMVERYAPPSLLVSPEDHAAHLSEHAGRYLVHPGGELTANVFKLVREELRVELRAALRTVRERGRPQRTSPVPVRFNGETALVVMDVRPSLEPAEDGFALVIFDEREEAASIGTSGAGASAATPDARMEELEAERDLARERLRGVIEEYETSREEMKASNEELQSTNEELRSTLEELETSKEELQSMNEELQTVNQENRHKVAELGQLSSDLQNLLAATDIATIFLDRELRILRFTPKLSELFNVRMTDRGRPLSDLTNRLADSGVLAGARDVLHTLVPLEREVKDQTGRWYLTRVLPYRSTEDRIEGVVITFIDITDRKEAELAIRDWSRVLEERVDERTREVRQLAATLTVAEEEERRKISRLLHDDLQQLLYGIQMKMELAWQKGMDGNLEEVVSQTEKSLELLGQALAQTRSLAVDLSPPALEEGRLEEAIQWLGSQIEEMHGVHVEIQVHEPTAMESRERCFLLFGTVRELLFNVVKHAATDRALIEIGREGREGRIEVTDEGGGFDPGTLDAPASELGGLGLFRVRERLRLQGGRLEVRSRPGEGTSVAVYLPVSDSPEGGEEDEDSGTSEDASSSSISGK